MTADDIENAPTQLIDTRCRYRVTAFFEPIPFFRRGAVVTIDDATGIDDALTRGYDALEAALGRRPRGIYAVRIRERAVTSALHGAASNPGAERVSPRHDATRVAGRLSDDPGFGTGGGAL